MNENECNKRRLTNPVIVLNETSQSKYLYDLQFERNAFYIRNKLYDRLALLQYRSRKRRENVENESTSRVLRKRENNA